MNRFAAISIPGKNDGVIYTNRLIWLEDKVEEQKESLGISTFVIDYIIEDLKKMVETENVKAIIHVLKFVPEEIEKKILSYCTCFYCKKPTLKTGKAAGAGGIAIADTEFVCEDCSERED